MPVFRVVAIAIMVRVRFWPLGDPKLLLCYKPITITQTFGFAKMAVPLFSLSLNSYL